MMKAAIAGIVAFMVVIGGSIVHERDILSACLKYGHSGHAMLTAKIKCEEFK